MRRTGERLSALASVMKSYPQAARGIRVTKEGKLMFYTDREINDAIADAKRELGESGRIVVRPSGTEPLIRIMVEGEDEEQIDGIAQCVADIIEDRIGEK